jgi:hypothetical protein
MNRKHAKLATQVRKAKRDSLARERPKTSTSSIKSKSNKLEKQLSLSLLHFYKKKIFFFIK